jgi:small subunit ribosomal protein S3
MGQKINPIGFRTGSFLPWKSRWFSDTKRFKEFLLEDLKIRSALTAKLKMAGLAMVEIERLPKSLVIVLTVSRPGMVIGRGGSGLEELKRSLLDVVGINKKKDVKIDFKINEVENPEISAPLVAGRIVNEMERRIPHRRVVTKAMERVMQAGALGIKVVLSGRIEGADISRVEKYHLGSVPAQTMREEIDYFETPALLKRGYVGVKVYIHHKKS